MSFRVETNVRVPMRDGETLAADVYIPDGGPVPALVVRLPYGKNNTSALGIAVNPDIHTLLEAGYAVVRQDCRGTFASGGTFTPLADEPKDGVDTIGWVREQAWCNGTVGSYGPSYLGWTQWASGSQSPDGLKAMAPAMTTPDLYQAWHSPGGAVSWHNFIFWNTYMALTEAQRAIDAGTGDPQAVTELSEAIVHLDRSLDAMPAEQKLLAKYVPWWSEWLQHPHQDDFWAQLSPADQLGAVTVPALHIGGWFDLWAGETARSYTRMKAEAGTAEARSGQRLIMGPWNHLDQSGLYHDRQFGLTSDAVVMNITGAYVSFFDRWLRGQIDALDGAAPVRIFVMGIDQWRDEPDWPLPDTNYVDYFLHGAGRANTSEGDGVLRTDPPSEAAVDTYTYDPNRPVPSLGGRIMLPAALNAVGPVNQESVEARDDVLCFTTPALDESIEVTGHVSLVLHVLSSARDTDFTGKLVDVAPDGRATYLTDGILRARYRHSLAHPELLEPGEVYEVTLDLAVTSNVFLPGHRIRLEISSSSFPRYDRNTNTGGNINQESLEDAVIAINKILHGPEHPSRLILPVIAR